MKRVVAWVLALSVGAWAQEGGGNKEGGNKEGARPAAQEKGKEGGGAAGSLTVAEVDTNGDGRISLAELKAALSRLSGGGKEGGERKGAPRKDGGDGQKKPGGEGDGQKKIGGEGDGQKKPDGAEGQKREGDKR
jgi:hypothetical protein